MVLLATRVEPTKFSDQTGSVLSYPSFSEGIQNDKKPITTATTMTTKQNNSCHTLHQAIFFIIFFSRTKVALLLEVKVAFLLEVLVVTETTINSSSVPNVPRLFPFLSGHLLYRHSSILAKFRVLSKLVAVSSLCTLQTLHACPLLLTCLFIWQPETRCLDLA